MRCNTAQQLLHLSRDGERSDRQERRLARHLLTCASCRELAERQASEYDALLHTLRETQLNATKEDVLVHGVLARIAQQRQTVARERPRYEAATSLVLRYAAAILVLLITGGFLFQFVTVHNRVDALGRQLAGAGISNVMVEIDYNVRPNSAELLSPDSLRLLSLQQAAFIEGRQFTRRNAETLLRMAAIHPRKLDAATVQRLLSVVVITPQLTLRIQEQGA